VLRDAGVSVDTHVLFAGQVMRQVSRIAALQAGGELSAGRRRAIGADGR